MVASSRHGPVSNREWRQWSHMLHNWKKPYKCSYCWKTKKEKKTKTKTNKNKNVHFVRLRDIYIKPKKKKYNTIHIYLYLLKGTSDILWSFSSDTTGVEKTGTLCFLEDVETVVVVFVVGVEFWSRVFRTDGFFSTSSVFWGQGVSLRTENTVLGWFSISSDSWFHNSSNSVDVVKSLLM